MEEGSARWATDADLRHNGWFDTAGWPLGTIGGTRVYLPALTQRQHTFVLAPPGAGKSRGILVPALFSEGQQPPAARRSLIVLDPAAELYRLTAPTLARTHHILCWNPARPTLSNTLFDPLGYLPPPDVDGFVSACEQAAAIWWTALGGGVRGGDPFWDRMPSNALKAIIIARACLQPGLTMQDVMAYMMPLSGAELKRDLEDSSHLVARLRGAVMAEILKSDKMEASVFSDLRERVLILANTTVARVIGQPSIRAQDFMDRPTMLYLHIGAESKALRPLFSVVLSTLVNQLVGLSSGGRVLPRDVRVVIDELANIGRLYDLADSLATMRKYGIGFLMATQTRALLTNVYGPDMATGIIDTCGTLVALGGQAFEDGAWLSRNLGAREWVEERTTRRYGLGATKVPLLPTLEGKMSAASIFYPKVRSRTERERRHAPLIAPHQLRGLPHNLVVVPTRMPPVLCALELYTGG